MKQTGRPQPRPLASQQKSENLPEMDADPRITTELLSHQKQGLYFLTNKEKERIFSDKEEDNSSL